jgi:hypothetical protein
MVRNEKGDLFTDYHSILTRWRNHFCQLFNAHGVSDVRQTEIHTEEPLLPEPSAYEVAMAIEKLNRHKSPSIDQIPAELIKAGGRTIRSEIHELIYSIWNLEKLPEEWKESIIVVFIRAIKHSEVIIKAYHFCQPHTKFYPTPCCQG